MKTSMDQLTRGLDFVLQSPKDVGSLELIVRRPRVDARESLEEGELSIQEGLVGDNWKPRGSNTMPDGSAHPERQITLMNSRLISLLADEKQLWSLAGDQLFVDLDLSLANLPPSTQISIGSAILEMTPPPHRGCKKFAARFGLEAIEFISLPERKDLRLRGIYARVLQPGIIRTGDMVRKR